MKSCMFVRNRSIIKKFLNHFFWPKYQFIIHNNASSNKQHLIGVYFSSDLDVITFSLEKAILRTVAILAGSNSFKLKLLI